jgi:hypothetical protein
MQSRAADDLRAVALPRARGPHQAGTPPFLTKIVSLNALAATLIPPWNGTVALAGVNAADQSAPANIPHVTITTRIMLLLK